MLFSVFMLAVKSVYRNLLRSFLTILGIVIGVSAVITMVTIGNGATQAIKDQISSLGTSILLLSPGQRIAGERGEVAVSRSLQKPMPMPSAIKLAGSNLRSQHRSVRWLPLPMGAIGRL